MKRSSSPSAATISRLVEPTSVTTVSSPQAASASRASSTRPETGAAQKTSVGALAGLGDRGRGAVDGADADRPRHRLGVGVEADDVGAVDPALAARPIEPPIRPTPRTAILIARAAP